jgi:hypothetical protein
MRLAYVPRAEPNIAAAVVTIISGGNQMESAMSEMYYLYYTTPSPLPRFVIDWIRSNFGRAASGR